jgi:hypothetical protein
MGKVYQKGRVCEPQHCRISRTGGLLTYILNRVSGLSDPY